MKSNNIKLYNSVYSPFLFIYFFPHFILISLPINFIIDSLVLLLGLKIFGKENVFYNYKKSILKVWLYGYLADSIGASVQFGFEWIAYANNFSIMLNPLGGALPFCATLISIGIAGLFVYIFNIKVCLDKSTLNEKATNKTALLLAFCTAPYMFFVF